MTFDVDFGVNPMTLDAEMGEIYDVSAGEAERIYQDGYTTGKTEGYESGKTDGYASGEADGYAKGYEKGMAVSYDAGYADGKKDGSSSADAIIERSISGEYVNGSVTAIGAHAFYGCKESFSVRFLTATSIGSSAFYNCSGLTSVDIPLATSIGSDVFRSCTALTTVSFPSVTVITTNAFYTCSKLATADFAAAVAIYTKAFYGCLKLTKLILRNPSVVCTLSKTDALSETLIKSGAGYIYVPDDLVDDYKAATNWSSFASKIKPLSELEE